MFDAELYRPKAEVEDWKKHGPLITFTTRMKAEGLITEDDFQSITRDVEREVAEAIAFAEAGTWEPVEDLMRFVHSERNTP
jgi:TPP-dependent pyruvate/acetoin dehydrogenase alpha subunit